MKRKDLVELIDRITTLYEVDRERVKDAFKRALELGCCSEYGVESCRVNINEERKEVNVYTQRLVVSSYSEAQRFDGKRISQITLEKAHEKKPRAKVGDIIEEEVDPRKFGYNAAKKVKDQFNILIRGLNQENIFQYFLDQVGQIISVRVISTDEKGIRVDVGRDISAFIPYDQLLETENPHQGETLKVVLTSVSKEREINLKLSRKAPELVERLLEQEIPEIKEGIVEIIGVSREAGDRSKVCVKSNRENIDPVGSCIGENGIRIRNVRRALNNENIDLFKYSENPEDLIKNALTPAEIVKVVAIDTENLAATAIVKDDQLSLAIGKAGLNVRLAMNAIKWKKIDIKSATQAYEEGIVY